VRVLLACTRGAGHFNPLVPFARAAAARGYEVRFTGPPSLAAPVAAAGFAFEPFDDPPAEELGAVWERVPSLAPDDANVVVIAEIFGRLNTTAALPRLLDVCERWRPDIVLRDPALFAAALAAERCGIPVARVGIGLVSTEHEALCIAAAPVDAIRGDLGLVADPGAERLRASPYLTAFPASLEDPEVPEPAHTVRVRDPAWDEAPAPLPRWWGDDGRPLAYLTFGSVAGAMPMNAPAYAAAIEAVAGLEVRALLTVGLEADLDALPPAPPNLRVERWVPQADVLAEAAAVVHHGGSGSTLGALAAGLPSVVVPLFADQPHNARRVAASGAGLVVAPPSAPAIRAALASVLDRPRWPAPGRIATELRAQRDPGPALDLLLASPQTGASSLGT
jgi:UDP:flavonoid glycosyltransferase YjiC (YdhE family)